MAEIKEFGLMLLFVSAGSLIYCFLLPSGSVSKTAKTVISIVLMTLVFLPIFSVFGSLSGDDFNFSGSYEAEDYNSYLEDAVKAVTEDVIKKTVRKFTNVPYETEIFVNKSEDGNINIEYVGINFSAKPQHESELTKALTEALGIIPHIRVELTDE